MKLKEMEINISIDRYIKREAAAPTTWIGRFFRFYGSSR
jgi:hypothetical protein